MEHLDPARLAGLLEEMEKEGRDELHREGAAPEDIAVSRVLDMRYRDQTHETPVDVSDLDLDEEPIPALLTRFHDAYQDLYRYTQRDQACEIINARVTVIAKAPAATLQPIAPSGAPLSAAIDGSRQICLPDTGETVRVPVYASSSLGAGHSIPGPAIVEEPDTTIMVFPNWRLEVTPNPAYLMTDLGGSVRGSRT